jgi:hypothetical protein
MSSWDGNIPNRRALNFMPLYFFDLQWNGRDLPGKPHWFSNVGAAERVIRAAAQEIKANLGVPKLNIRIRDEHNVIRKELDVSD